MKTYGAGGVGFMSMVCVTSLCVVVDLAADHFVLALAYCARAVRMSRLGKSRQLVHTGNRPSGKDNSARVTTPFPSTSTSSKRSRMSFRTVELLAFEKKLASVRHPVTSKPQVRSSAVGRCTVEF